MFEAAALGACDRGGYCQGGRLLVPELQLPELGVLQEGVARLDPGHDESGQPFAEAAFEHIEFEEAHQRVEHQVPRAAAFAFAVQVLRGVRRMLVERFELVGEARVGVVVQIPA